MLFEFLHEMLKVSLAFLGRWAAKGAVLASVVPAFVWLRAVCIGVSSRGDASLLSRPGATHQATCRPPDNCGRCVAGAAAVPQLLVQEWQFVFLK